MFKATLILEDTRIDLRQIDEGDPTNPNALVMIFSDIPTGLTHTLPVTTFQATAIVALALGGEEITDEATQAYFRGIADPLTKNLPPELSPYP